MKTNHENKAFIEYIRAGSYFYPETAHLQEQCISFKLYLFMKLKQKE